MAMPRLQPGQRAGTRLISCHCLQCLCWLLQDGQCKCPCPQGLQPNPSQICPAQPTPGCCSLPSAQLPCPRYLYMVSASTSPNQTLRCAWKYSPCTSSMATSPPPVSCDRHRAWQGWVGYEPRLLLPQAALPVHLIVSFPLENGRCHRGRRAQEEEAQGRQVTGRGSPRLCPPAGQR